MVSITRRPDRLGDPQGLLTSITREMKFIREWEIDRVMVDTDGTLVFVEVKTRANEDFGPTESAITSNKKTRMLRAARYFLATHTIENRPYRFDVVTIVVQDRFGRIGVLFVRLVQSSLPPVNSRESIGIKSLRHHANGHLLIRRRNELQMQTMTDVSGQVQCYPALPGFDRNNGLLVQRPGD